MLDALDRRGLASPRALQALAAIHVRAGPVRRGTRGRSNARPRPPRPSASLLIELARTAVKLKDYKGALGYLAHARSLEPANAAVHFLFGMVCVEQNLGGEAYESMKKAVELDPDNPLVNYAMGAVATHRHEPSESLPYFEKYVRLKPDDPARPLRAGRGAVLQQSVRGGPTRARTRGACAETATGAHYFLGRIARQANDLATARREIERGAAPQRGPGRCVGRAGADSDPLERVRTGGAIADEGAGDRPGPLRGVGEPGGALLPERRTHAGRHRPPGSAALIEKREARAQEFLRIIEAVPNVR